LHVLGRDGFEAFPVSEGDMSVDVVVLMMIQKQPQHHHHPTSRLMLSQVPLAHALSR
jgi:hypothetical protein